MNVNFAQLYAITDRHWLNGRTLASQVREVLEGGATMVQLREKTLGDEEFLAEAREIQRLCAEFEVPLIINDNVAIARQIGAGVHLGQSDMGLLEARKLLGPKAIIGVSCKTVALAHEAEANGADYLGVGAVFPTTTKSDARELPRETLVEICHAVKIPVVAIGGITLQNVHELVGTGIAGIAVISALFSAPSPRAAAQAFRSLGPFNL
ncbi:MAG: thiamine phosphate synthase [Victivallales bacterium]|nr:thiamine phosphate synthase [Victivallales bacterium]